MLLAKSEHTLIYQIPFPPEPGPAGWLPPRLALLPGQQPSRQASSYGQRQGLEGLPCPLE